MEYSALDQSGWTRFLPVFKNLLRPSFVSDQIGQLGEFESCGAAITQARAANASFGVLGDKLPNLVFDGYRDWYQYDDTWVLQELAHVLDDSGEQQTRLINGLQEIGTAATDDSRKIAFDSFATTIEQYVSTWQAEAEAQGYTRAEVVDEAATIEGTRNATNWQADRLPGTYYYAYVDGRYLYSDLAEGPISEWETLPVREQLATELAQPWGAAFCTPTGGNPDYGGEYVFALDKGGPWMSQAAIEAALQARPAAASVQPEQAGQGSTAAVVVPKIGKDRATMLDELFAELTANGWDPEKAEDEDEPMPSREEIIARFDSRVEDGLTSMSAG